MTIQVGGKIPSVTLKVMQDGNMNDIATDAIFSGLSHPQYPAGTNFHITLLKRPKILKAFFIRVGRNNVGIKLPRGLQIVVNASYARLFQFMHSLACHES